ncbi:hypothetical protein Aab01nite_59210 [Paractinoplanes abujensis]|nr:hypothetical protein Aab01nite_59210 [Actinoplanes abujensis]
MVFSSVTDASGPSDIYAPVLSRRPAEHESTAARRAELENPRETRMTMAHAANGNRSVIACLECRPSSRGSDQTDATKALDGGCAAIGGTLTYCGASGQVHRPHTRGSVSPS